MFECRIITPEFFQTAPCIFVSECEVPATPDALFKIFEDENSWPVWAAGIEKVEWTTPRPFGVGTKRTVTLGGGLVVNELFVAWDPGKRMTFCFTSANQKIWSAFGEDYVVTDLGNGRSKLRWTVAFEPCGVYRWIMKIAGPGMRLWTGKIAKGLVRYAAARAK